MFSKTFCICFNVLHIGSFIDTNLIHSFLYKLHKIKFLYMFRASSAHLQEVNDVSCTCMQPLVFSFSAGGRLERLLTGDCKCTRRPPAENENTRGCIHVQITSLTSWRWADDARNMYRNLILCNLYKKLCIKLVSIKELYYNARPTKSQDSYWLFL